MILSRKVLSAEQSLAVHRRQLILGIFGAPATRNLAANLAGAIRLAWLVQIRNPQRGFVLRAFLELPLLCSFNLCRADPQRKNLPIDVPGTDSAFATQSWTQYRAHDSTRIL